MHNQTALVTGASSGIGEAVAENLVNRGFRVVLMARRRQRLERLQQRLGCRSHVLACDVTDRVAVKAALDGLPAEFACIDVLVNNAGLALGLEPAQTADWTAWERMLETNCKALASLCHLLLPWMVERGAGHIINIGSVAGSYPYAGGNVYAASKSFVEHFTSNLKADLLGTPVRVTTVEPGMVGDTEFSLVRFAGDRVTAAEAVAGAQPLTPSDIAECVSWVVSRPAHVNVTRVELMPTCQAPARLAINRHQE